MMIEMSLWKSSRIASLQLDISELPDPKGPKPDKNLFAIWPHWYTKVLILARLLLLLLLMMIMKTLLGKGLSSRKYKIA